MYEQLEMGVTLDSERDLKENISMAVEFACHQVADQNPGEIANRQEGYGVLVEVQTKLQSTVKELDKGMKDFRLVLSAGDPDAVERANAIYDACSELTYQAARMAGYASKVMNDLYHHAGYEPTPPEEYAESLGEEFHEAEPEEEKSLAERAFDKAHEKYSKEEE